MSAYLFTRFCLTLLYKHVSLFKYKTDRLFSNSFTNEKINYLIFWSLKIEKLFLNFGLRPVFPYIVSFFGLGPKESATSFLTSFLLSTTASDSTRHAEKRFRTFPICKRFRGVFTNEESTLS